MLKKKQDFNQIKALDSIIENVGIPVGEDEIQAQIKPDFSGYTDIAIGLALLMGFQLPVNFNSPYKATNAGDFWKRWHMSLSTWLRDYLYIPLGGNRKGSSGSYIILGLMLLVLLIAFRSNFFLISLILIAVTLIFITGFYNSFVKNQINTNINLMLTMLIGGLWHGASWKFVIWGGLNGLGILVYKYWRKRSPYELKNQWYVRFWKIGITFLFITFTRIYFRGESMEHISKWYFQVWNRMDMQSAWTIVTNYQAVFLVMLVGYITHWVPQTSKNYVENLYAKSPVFIKIILGAMIGMICYQAFSSDFQPFIYFQF